MTSEALHIVIAGGGTGGHLFPAVSIAQQFMAENPSNRVLFVSTGKPLEVSVLEKYGFDLERISAAGIKGRGFFGKAKALFPLARGVFESGRIIESFRPDLVIGMGSYSAAPMVFKAWLKNVPVVLCEQNIMPGIANRYLSKLADRIYVSFEDTGGGLPEEKVRCTGNPVRREILEAGRQSKASGAPFTVLILGGSQGAHRVNMAVVEALEILKETEGLFFIHQTGEADREIVRAAYEASGVSAEVEAFYLDMASVYQRTDLAVCRAGAATVAELSALAIPAFFIPYPFAADDHQRLNAQNLCDAGAAEMVLETELTGEMLAEKIIRLAEDPELLRQMARNAESFGRPDAAERIVEDCRRLIEEKTGIRE